MFVYSLFMIPYGFLNEEAHLSPVQRAYLCCLTQSSPVLSLPAFEEPNLRVTSGTELYEDKRMQRAELGRQELWWLIKGTGAKHQNISLQKKNYEESRKLSKQRWRQRQTFCVTLTSLVERESRPHWRGHGQFICWTERRHSAKLTGKQPKLVQSSGSGLPAAALLEL